MTAPDGQTEILSHGTHVYVDETHRFGADAILLSHFAGVRRTESACDLGTGCGIIPLRWHDRGHRGACVALDISGAAIALLEQSLAHGGITHITPVCADLRTWTPPQHNFHVVTCNPPYFTGGFLSPTPARAAARHEGSCTLDEVCALAGKLLRDGGRFCVCQRPARLADVCCAMRAAHIEPKRLQFVTARPDKEPWLFLLEGHKRRASGLRMLPLLVTENADGSRPTPAMQEIYES